MGRFKLRLVGLVVMPLVAVAAGFWGGGAAAAGYGVSGSLVTANVTGGVPAGTSQSIGGASTPINFVLTDESADSLGGATLTPPAGFTIVSATPIPGDGDGDEGDNPNKDLVSGNVLQLHDLDLSTGGEIIVPLQVTASCSAVAQSWTLTASSNDDGVGGSLTVDPASNLSVPVLGQCALAFPAAAQPTNAAASTDITSSGFNPGGSPVEVEASDAVGNPIPGIGVTAAAELGTGSLTGGNPTSVTDPSGAASFPGMQIAQTGYYQLLATAPSFVSATSNLFQITGSVAPCTGSCSGSASSSSVAVSVDVTNPGSGDLLSVGLGGFTYSCPDRFSPTGYYQAATGPVGIDLWQANGSSLDPSQRTEVVTLTIPDQYIPHKPLASLLKLLGFQVCYASTVPFKGGTLVSSGQSIPGYAGSTYVGLLPLCPFFHPQDAAPCLLTRYYTWDGDLVIKFLGAAGDFWGSA